MVRDSFVRLTPTEDDFRLAASWLGYFETGLRAGDALHLAIARNHDAAAIYTLDKGMLIAGEMLELPTTAGPIAMSWQGHAFS